ncbi:hypothetical protein NPIL_485931, partial [Nephila pilipes]
MEKEQDNLLTLASRVADLDSAIKQNRQLTLPQFPKRTRNMGYCSSTSSHLSISI